MQMHEFLSDAWFDAVQLLKANLDDDPIEEQGLVVNATITGVPVGEGALELHSGPMVGWQHGHSADALLSFVIDDHLARQLVLDDSPNFDVLVQEVTGGALENAVRAITA